MKTVKYKWITGGLELMFSIPTLSMLLIKDTFYIPLLIMFCAHTFTFLTAMSENENTYGSIAGMFTSVVGAFYSFGWLLHLITAIFLLADATINQKQNKEKWENKLKKSLALEQILDKINPILIYEDAGYEICLDTSILTNNYDELVYLLEYNGIKLNISRAVYDEINRDRSSENEDKRLRAQRAISLLESYQMSGLLEIMNIPSEEETFELGLGQSPIDIIIATYKIEAKKGRHLAFLSDDKGARILARQVGIETIHYGEQEDKPRISVKRLERKLNKIKEKEVLISIFLTFVGGPFGLLYSSTTYGIIMIIATFMLLKMNIYGAMLGWMINIALGVLLTLNHNNKLRDKILNAEKEAA